MSKMTMLSRDRMRNLNPEGLRPSALPLGHGDPHNTDFYEWMGKKHFCLSNRRDRKTNPEL